MSAAEKKNNSPESNASSVYEDDYLASPPAHTMDMEQVDEQSVEIEKDSSPRSSLNSNNSVHGSPNITFKRVNRSVNNSQRRLSISRQGKFQRTEGSRWQKDFTTIDFLMDSHQHRLDNKLKTLEYKQQGWIGFLKRIIWGSQGWIALLAVGLATAATTVFIQSASLWLLGFRKGVCQFGIFVDKSSCCLEKAGDSCDNWKSWSQLISGSQNQYADYAIYVFSGILLAMMSGYFTLVFSEKAAGGGIPEVKSVLGGFIFRQILGAWVLFIKTIGIILTEASGLSLGSRGPLIHISCCWGNIICRNFPKYKGNEGKKREILSASASAGVSAGFGSPLGGVLFSAEALSTYFSKNATWRSFFCAIVAALALKALYQNPLGKIVPFQITYVHDFMWPEMIPFVFLGIIGGIFGALFIRINVYIQSLRSKAWSDYPIVEIAILALVTSLISIVSAFLRVDNISLISSMFDICENLNPNSDVNSILCAEPQLSIAGMLVFVAIIKFILTCFSFGAKLPGGIWMPLISIGACLGRAVGILMHELQSVSPDSFWFSSCSRSSSNCIYPGIYAIVGASAMLGGVTRLNVCLAVTMFEVTGSLIYIIPIMVSTVTSKLVGDLFGNHGIYDILVAWKRYPYIAPTAEADPTISAQVVMSSNPVVLYAYSETLESITRLLDRHTFAGFPVVLSKEKPRVLGYITRADLYTAIESAVDKGMHKSAPAFLADSLQIQNPPPGYADISSYVDEFPILIIPETPLDILLDIFKGIGLRCAMVINSNDELVGIIKKKDLAVFISTTVVANEFISKSRASRLSLYQSLNQEDEPFLQIHNKSLD